MPFMNITFGDLYGEARSRNSRLANISLPDIGYRASLEEMNLGICYAQA